MNDINERIYLLRKELGLSRAKFGEPFGASDGVVKNMDTRKTVPKPFMISQICDIYNVNQTWLETGEGEMFRETTREEELAAFIADVLAEQTAESEFKATFLECLAKMTPEQWKALQDFCDALAAKDKKDED